MHTIRQSYKEIREEKYIGKYADVEDKYNGVRYTVKILKRSTKSTNDVEHWLVEPVNGEGQMYKRAEHLHKLRKEP